MFREATTTTVEEFLRKPSSNWRHPKRFLLSYHAAQIGGRRKGCWVVGKIRQLVPRRTRTMILQIDRSPYSN